MARPASAPAPHPFMPHDIDERGFSNWAWRIASTAVNTRAAIQDPIELAYFLDLIDRKLDRPMTVVEVGTSMGGTFFALAQAAATKALLVSVDAGTWLGGAYASHGELKQWALPEQQIEVVYGNSQTAAVREMLRQTLRRHGRKKIDLLFIDADHHYDAVQKDWELYAPLVRRGGLVGFHDINRDGFIHQEGCEVFQWWRDRKDGGQIPMPRWEIVHAPQFGIGVYQQPGR